MTFLWSTVLWWALGFAVFVAILIMLRTIVRPWIYDTMIVKMTETWYREFLNRVPRNSRVLDVGIGTGAALLANSDLILEKGLKITGVDYDADYVASCDAAIRAVKLENVVAVQNASIYDYNGGPFDAVYFSGSLMLMPDATAALIHCASLLAPGGRIYSTQTFEAKRNVALELLKPLLGWLTTVDFGPVHYESHALAPFENAKLRIVCNERFGNSRSKWRNYRIIVGEPMTNTPKSAASIDADA